VTDTHEGHEDDDDVAGEDDGVASWHRVQHHSQLVLEQQHGEGAFLLVVHSVHEKVLTVAVVVADTSWRMLDAAAADGACEDTDIAAAAQDSSEIAACDCWDDCLPNEAWMEAPHDEIIVVVVVNAADVDCCLGAVVLAWVYQKQHRHPLPRDGDEEKHPFGYYLLGL